MARWCRRQGARSCGCCESLKRVERRCHRGLCRQQRIAPEVVTDAMAKYGLHLESRHINLSYKLAKHNMLYSYIILSIQYIINILSYAIYAELLGAPRTGRTSAWTTSSLDRQEHVG